MPKLIQNGNVTYYKLYRISAGYSREAASELTKIPTSSLARYEDGLQDPPPGAVLEMSRNYNAPDLTLRYCRECCPIGRVYSYDWLNNIDLSLPTVLLKLTSEFKEAMQAIDVLLELVINKKGRSDFLDAEWLAFMEAVQEFIDIEHNVEILKVALEGLTKEPTLIQELVKEHNQKCLDHGYIRKEKRPLQAAK